MDKLKIDFYLIPDTTLEKRNVFACRLIEKAYQQKCRVYVHVASEAEAKTLDDLLWIFRDISFIPHALYTTEVAQTSDALITIGWEVAQRDISLDTLSISILINLTNEEVADCTKPFTRIIEIIISDSAAKAIGRKKYSFYKKEKYDITLYDLTKNHNV